MERMHKQNGCLSVLPGTHRSELFRHSYPDWKGGVNSMYYGVKEYTLEHTSLVDLNMERGDTVFFHPLLVHGSGPNLTSGFRKAISCHYADSECEYIDVVGTIQEDFKKEVEAIAARKAGLGPDEKIHVNDVWRFKSRLVSGERIHL